MPAIRGGRSNARPMRHSKSLASVRGARLGAALRVDVLLRVARQRGDYADAMACEELTEPVHVGLHQHRQVAPVDNLDAQGRGALDERAECGVHLRRAAGDIQRGDGRRGGKHGEDAVHRLQRHRLRALWRRLDVTMGARLVAVQPDVDLWWRAQEEEGLATQEDGAGCAQQQRARGVYAGAAFTCKRVVAPRVSGTPVGCTPRSSRNGAKSGTPIASSARRRRFFSSRVSRAWPCFRSFCRLISTPSESPVSLAMSFSVSGTSDDIERGEATDRRMPERRATARKADGVRHIDAVGEKGPPRDGQVQDLRIAVTGP